MRRIETDHFALSIRFVYHSVEHCLQWIGFASALKTIEILHANSKCISSIGTNEVLIVLVEQCNDTRRHFVRNGNDINKVEALRNLINRQLHTLASFHRSHVLRYIRLHQVKEDSIYYAQGEIEKALGGSDAALADFRECISRTDDNTMKTRAYLMMNEIYEAKGSDTTQREILLEAKEVLPVENQMQILENLAQIDIDLADRSGNGQYRQEAIDVLGEIVSQGWDTYDTYDTLAVLYEKQGQLDSARQTVDTMMEKFGEDYNVYMRYAFLEIDAQELLDNSDRDYTQFAQYYEKALQLYNEEMTDNNEDNEMLLLESVYAQVVEGGWLE